MTEGGEWQTYFTERARKGIGALSQVEQQRIRLRLYALCAGLDRGELVGDVRKMQGQEGVWRLRVGDTAFNSKEDNETFLIVVLSVTHRREAYR